MREQTGKWMVVQREIYLRRIECHGEGLPQALLQLGGDESLTTLIVEDALGGWGRAPTRSLVRIQGVGRVAESKPVKTQA